MLQIGPYQLSAIETGTFGLDGGAMFGMIPKTIWSKTNPSNEENRIPLHARALLIQGNGRNILIDTGMGHKWAEKWIPMYDIDYSKWSLSQSLAAKNLKPEDITDLILTHLHFDHAGGATIFQDPKNPDKGVLPTFPNARVYVQKRNWDLAWSRHEKDKASYLSENYSPYAEDGDFHSKLVLLDTKTTAPTGEETYSSPTLHEDEFLPGISAIVSNGHTLGLQMIRISDGKTHLTYCADAVPTSSHVRLPFVMAYDCYPMFMIAEKKQILGRAQEEGGYIFYEHCPHMAASSIVPHKKDFAPGDPVDLT